MSVKTSHIASFIVRLPYEQVWIIKDVDSDQLRWLQLLAQCIPNSCVEVDHRINPEAVVLGLLDYMTFRIVLNEAGYISEVSKADARYRHSRYGPG